jgi:hypothetical protein
MTIQIGADGLEVRGSRKRTRRHPDNPAVCGCVRSCMLTKAECHRFRIACRYRSEAVRPAFVPAPSEQTDDQLEEGAR